mgnify:CR=1 FL=1|tara:strand:- start:1591 stop:2388 length:798 start_codon:yes stop_codon:yes gene_type:complete
MNSIEELLKISNISVEAGRIILDFYNKNLDITFKTDESPLTQADLASNKFITDSIKKISPNIPILSEEEFIEWDIRKEWKKYWLIDPLDGTKEFIKKNGEFTVNIALIENNRPILGVIYAPVSNELYFSKKNFGSYKILTNKKLNTLDNANKISIKIKKKNHVKIIGSRSHSNPILHKWVSNNFNEFEILQKGSSLKFCLIAEGFADIYPRFGPTSEWDIAAGHIILEEAGGRLKSIDNKEILYNEKENILNPNFFAYNNIDFIN